MTLAVRIDRNSGRSMRLALLVTALLFSTWSVGSSQDDGVAGHRGAATAAALGSDLLTRWTAIMCSGPSEREQLETNLRSEFMGLSLGVNSAEQLQLEPVKIFDNLYLLGTKLVDAFAIATRAGIIMIDSLNSGEKVVAA
jgi:hypothetical protein